MCRVSCKGKLVDRQISLSRLAAGSLLWPRSVHSRSFINIQCILKGGSSQQPLSPDGWFCYLRENPWAALFTVSQFSFSLTLVLSWHNRRHLNLSGLITNRLLCTGMGGQGWVDALSVVWLHLPQQKCPQETMHNGSLSIHTDLYCF